jgi:hypothetical protein
MPFGRRCTDGVFYAAEWFIHERVRAELWGTGDGWGHPEWIAVGRRGGRGG